MAGRGRAGAACRGARDGRSACSFLVPYINGARDGMDLSDSAAATPGAGTASRGPSRRTSAPSRAACASRCPTGQISLDTLSLSGYPIFVWIPYLYLSWSCVRLKVPPTTRRHAHDHEKIPTRQAPHINSGGVRLATPRPAGWLGGARAEPGRGLMGAGRGGGRRATRTL